MTKILFLIHDLGQGGAEKVLVNLVNNMDRSKFDISVTTLFGGGVNEQFLAPDIHFRAVFPRMLPGNSSDGDAADNQDESAGPELLVQGKRKAPEQAGGTSSVYFLF